MYVTLLVTEAEWDDSGIHGSNIETNRRQRNSMLTEINPHKQSQPPQCIYMKDIHLHKQCIYMKDTNLQTQCIYMKDTNLQTQEATGTVAI